MIPGESRSRETREGDSAILGDRDASGSVVPTDALLSQPSCPLGMGSREKSLQSRSPEWQLQAGGWGLVPSLCIPQPQGIELRCSRREDPSGA